MSAIAPAARPGPPPTRVGTPAPSRASALSGDQLLARERPVVRIAAFAALGLFGVTRWARLTEQPPTGRLLALLGVVVAFGAAAPVLSRRNRALPLVAGLLVVLAAFPLSGVPLAWVVHLRVAVTADAIGQGLTTLPRVLVPYSGEAEWVRMVITMGAALLLLDAGLLLAFAPPSLGDARRAGVALPLIALAVVPSTILRPRQPYLEGLLLLGLIAVFMWGERIRRQELAWALGTGVVIAAGAMVLAPSLDQHRPWINYQALAGQLVPAKLERFDWSQRYGPLNWPQTGRAVMEVRAARPEYWKAENLDTFNGHAWAAGTSSGLDALAGVSAAARTRWTQTIRVTLRAMTTSTVIAAGAADAPKRLASVMPGASAGTWTTTTPIGPGDSYAVRTYSPRPSSAELAAGGNRYPDRELTGFRTLYLPGSRSARGPVPVVFPPFHSGLAIRSGVGPAPGVVSASPYAGAYALARRLSARAVTPYGFVASVERYLGQGFSYSESPPASNFPLESFLFRDKLGYCQQFAGAMALLLRMGGIPARVATGFTSGTYDSATHVWLVSDLDAHAWVEAWFPRYGWVRFDPTPAAAPARGGRSPIAVTPAFANPAGAGLPLGLRHEGQVSAAPGGPAARAAGSSSPPLLVAVVALLVLLALAALGRRRRHVPGADALLLELERALRRSGRPLTAGMTLAALEQRLRSSPEAAAYVRAIRLDRFGGGTEPPTGAQRRALRAYLRDGLGFAGALRALWALPPGWPAGKRAS